MCRRWYPSVLACDKHRQAWFDQRSNKTKFCVIQCLWTMGTTRRQCRLVKRLAFRVLVLRLLCFEPLTHTGNEMWCGYGGHE